MLSYYVKLKVLSNVRNLSTNYRFEVCIYTFLEVVQPVQQSSHVSFERPARLSIFCQGDKCIKGIPLYKFADIDWTAIVYQGCQDLEEAGEIGEFWAHLYLLATLIILFVLLDEWRDIELCGYHNIVIAIILHDFQDLYLMSPEATTITIDKVSKEIK